MARKKTKAYPESFRKEAVKMADSSDRTAADVAREFSIHVGQIYNWRTQFNKLSKGNFLSLMGRTIQSLKKLIFVSLKKKSLG